MQRFQSFPKSLSGHQITRNLQITRKLHVVIGTESFQEKVLAIPGEELGWTAVLRVAYGDPDQLERVAKLMQWKRNLPEEDIHFMPPTTLNGKTQGAVLVSHGVVMQGGDMHVVDSLKKDGEINKEIHPSENDKVIEPPG